ncbi:hypothetical protein BGZ57DRAFT_456523 [Hyaloscypha finlandica]|nr:hypothetical protein BGZ57DRAFT_456523 [Hyaloscypha finlandica]
MPRKSSVNRKGHCAGGVENTDGWIHLAHTHEEVQHRLLKNESKQRQYAVDYFWIKNLENLNIFPTRHALDSWNVQKYFELFNKIFFFGALTDDFCELKFVEEVGVSREEWHRNRTHDDAEGYTTDPRRRLRYRGRTKISIFEQKDDVSKATLLRRYLGTLLHEMIHAFIHIYICLSPSCEAQTAQLEGTGLRRIRCELAWSRTRPWKG